MIDIVEKTGGRKYAGTEEVRMGEAGATYSQSNNCSFFPPGVAIGGGLSCCISFNLVEVVGLLVDPK